MSAPAAVQEPVAPAAAPVGLPDYFCCNLKCCAIALCGQSSPECMGCAQYGYCCFSEGDCIGCKGASADPDVKFICQKGLTKCSDFTICPKSYAQCFCIEYITDCQCNLDDVYSKAPQGGVSNFDNGEKSGFPDPENLSFFSGGICSISSLYCKFPECCCGSANASTCLCIKSSNIGGQCCTDTKICAKNDCVIVPIKTLCKGESQLCCCDNRYALPFDEENPCAFGMLGILLCVGCACKPAFCPTLKATLDKTKE